MRGPVNADAVQKNTHSAPAANAQANAQVAAIANEYHVLDSIHFGYDVAPATAKSLIVTFAGGSKHQITIPADITAIGPHEVIFPRGLYTGIVNQILSVSMPLGGVGRTGKVSITYR